MHRRCNDPSEKRYGSYGGRGIKVCKRWNDFSVFQADMGSRPEGTSIDRIDNDGDYKPSNCRWATMSEQQRNTRQTTFIETPQGRMNVMDAAEEFGIHPRTLHARIERGWTDEEAVKPKGHYGHGAGSDRRSGAELTAEND